MTPPIKMNPRQMAVTSLDPKINPKPANIPEKADLSKSVFAYQQELPKFEGNKTNTSDDAQNFRA